MPEDCSRAKSRVARALLRKRGILGAAMPATCPLHADLYGDQEQHKRALSAVKNKGAVVDYSASQVSTKSGRISPALPR